MKLHVFAVSLLVSVLLGLAQMAYAKDKPEPAVNAGDRDAFAAVAEWVRQQMKSGGRYAEIKSNERNTVNQRLDEIARMFEKTGSVDQMTLEEKKRLLVTQEEINSILGKRDGERLICTYERPIGSNVPVKSCETARERDERRNADRRDMERRQMNRQKKWG
jgi:hypothetical protein